MWPWEHLALGYVIYSFVSRAQKRESPPDLAVPWLVLGTQFPDLVDKPLAWSVGVLPSGISLAHSIFFAVPIAGLTVLVGRRIGRPDAAVGFAVGYLSHLPGDFLYPLLLGGGVYPDAFLWPVVEMAQDPPVGLVIRTRELFTEFLALLETPVGMFYVVGEFVLLGTALVTWAIDGRPGLGVVQGMVRSLRSHEEQ